MTPHGSDMRSRRPILVTGMPRSGTTWVGRILTASREVGYINEPFNLESPPGTPRLPVEHWYTYVAPENEERFLRPVLDLISFRYALARELRRCRTRTDVDHTLKMWLTSVRDRNRRPLIKEPHAVFSADWFRERFEADVVVTIRHPAAVVSSWKRLEWSFDFANLLNQPTLMRDRLEPLRAEMEEAVLPHRDLIDRVALLWRIVYSVVQEYARCSSRIHVVRQEDLSREPLQEYAKLYKALGLSFTHRAATAVALSTGSANPKETSIVSPHETKLDSKANLEHWKKRLTAEEVDRVRRATETIADAYYPEGEW
jgi:Sulfotransferase family